MIKSFKKSCSKDLVQKNECISELYYIKAFSVDTSGNFGWQ